MNKKKSYWGIGIVIFFLFLLIANGVVIVIVLGQEVDLVEDNYYEKEISYQDQINKQQNSADLTEATKILYSDNLLTIQLPPGLDYGRVKGNIAFYRPSDAQQDFIVPVLPDSTGKQFLNVSRLEKGRWKVTVDWNIGQQSYLDKKDIFIQ